MTRIAVLALTESEHQHLIEVWKFFPFSADIVFHYLYLGSDDSSVLPTNASLLATSFPEGTSAALQSIQSYMSEQRIEHLCFAGNSTFQMWSQVLRVPFVTVYAGKSQTILDLSGCSNDQYEHLRAQVESLHPHLAILSKENEQLPPSENTSFYHDYHSFCGSIGKETLLTRNTDLLSAVCAHDPVEYAVTHIMADTIAFDLAIGEEGMDFNLTLSTLRLLMQLCQQESAPKQVESAARQVQRSYSFFAGYYDNYMSHVDYNDWLALMLGWYKQQSQKPMKKVLEIACGTANASEILVFRGYEVDACDSSPLMLHYADAKVFKPNLFYGSMTDSLPRKEYDFAFCLFDSINYLTHKNDIKTLFKNVSLALRPGGIFIFDISTLFNSLQNFNETIHFTRVKDGYMIHDSRFEVLSNRQITHFTLFRKHGSVYHKLEEHHVQRVYRCPELAELIAASPLNLKAIHVPELRANLLPKLATGLDNRHTRIFFVLQKPE